MLFGAANYDYILTSVFPTIFPSHPESASVKQPHGIGLNDLRMIEPV